MGKRSSRQVSYFVPKVDIAEIVWSPLKGDMTRIHGRSENHRGLENSVKSSNLNNSLEHVEGA